MKVGALVVAAGLSSRMKAFKPMLPLDGDTLLRRGLNTLLQAGCAPVAVVTGHRAEELEASLSGLPVTCLYNPDYARCQMLDSVKLGLAWQEGRCERLLFSPGDVCLYGLDTVQALKEAAGPLCYPVCRGRRGHPVMISCELIPAVLGYGGERGLAGALEAADAGMELAVEDPGILLDADTPEDYRRLLEFQQRGDGGCERST